MFVLIQSYQSTSFRRRIERNSELTRLPKIGKDLVSLSRRNPPSSQCKSSRSQNDHYHHSRHLPSPILKCVLSGCCMGQLREHTSATWVVTWLVEMHASLFRQHRHDERMFKQLKTVQNLALGISCNWAVGRQKNLSATEQRFRLMLKVSKTNVV